MMFVIKVTTFVVLSVLTVWFSMKGVQLRLAEDKGESEEKVEVENINEFQKIIGILLVLVSVAFGWFVSGSETVNFVSWFQYMVLWIAILSATVFDYQLRIIPNIIPLVLVIQKIVVSIVLLIIKAIAIRELVVSILVAVVCIAILLVISRISHNGIGMGDVKLLATIGLCSGVAILWLTIVMASMVCLVVAVVLLVTKSKTLKDSLPFAPFILAGYFLTVVLTVV